MRRLLVFALVTSLAFGLAACTRTTRRVRGNIEFDGNLWQVKRPGVTVTEPPREGPEGFQVADTGSYYRVAKTDSLTSIAEKFYGGRHCERDIVELNRDVILAAGGVKRGLVLALPKIEKPEEPK